MSGAGVLRIVLVEFHARGGLTQHTGQLADALAAQGHDVRVLTTPGSELDGRLQHAVIALDLSGFDPREELARGYLSAPLQRLARAVMLGRAWRDLVRYVEHEDPDVVQLNELRSVLDAVGVAWLRHRCRRAVLVDLCHNVLPFSRRASARGALRSGPVIRAALASAYRRMDAVAVHGADSRRRFREEWPGVAPVAIVPHGDERLFGAPLPPARGAPTVLFFGNWAGYKGMDLLFEAFELVQARMPEARLSIVGSPTREVDLAWVMERCARFAGAARAIPGYADVEQTREAFRDATVVALPYREAFQSGVAFLAFTLARPVVCTRVGDIPAAVEASRGGHVVPVGDPPRFAEALVSLLRDPVGAAETGCRAHRWVLRESGWEVVAERFATVYREALGRNGVPPSDLRRPATLPLRGRLRGRRHRHRAEPGRPPDEGRGGEVSP